MVPMDPVHFLCIIDLFIFFIYLRERPCKAFAEGGKSGVLIFNSGMVDTEQLFSKAASICQPRSAFSSIEWLFT